MNTGWWEIDIHGRDSQVKFPFVPICMCKNNRQIWRHCGSTLCLHDITDQLRWCHNANLENIVLSDNGETSDQYWLLAELHVQDIKKHVRNKIIHWLPWLTIFGSLMKWFANDFYSWLHHLWKLLANRLTCDPKTVFHGNSCIILYSIAGLLRPW